MKAQLRRLHSPDAPHLERFFPENPENFGLLVQAMIGPENGKGEESFDFLVCTPAWLSSRVAERGYLSGRHHLIINRFDLDVIHRAIQSLCSQAVGPDWNSLADYLARFGKWEFEDYRGVPVKDPLG